MAGDRVAVYVTGYTIGGPRLCLVTTAHGAASADRSHPPRSRAYGLVI
jgi:hypothetical protein